MTIRLIAIVAIAITAIPPAQAQGDVSSGAQAFRQCAACHSLEPDLHLTGPSLSDVVGRPAGEAPGFKRYSKALKGSDFSWTQKALDQWLQNSEKMVPGTSMRIRPIADASMRQDIIAFLKASQSMAPENKAPSRMSDLKQAPRGQQVTAVRYCPDAYQVTVATGDSFTLWEFNLRFKTDSSSRGPLEGQPVLVGQGMRGDRAQIVFSAPTEISAFIQKECPEE
jgi:cytochrome c